MARHAKKSTVSDSGRKRKSEAKAKDRSDDGTDDDKSENEESKGRRSSMKKSYAEDGDSFEEDMQESDASDVEATPSKKKRVSFNPKDDEGEDESYESDKKHSPKKTKAKAKAKSSKPAEDNYEVEAIVGDRVIKGHVQYKVRWKGFGSDDDTWEGEDNLNCPELIEEYNDTRADDEAAKSAASKKKKDTSSDDGGGGANSESEADDDTTAKKGKGRPKKTKRGRPAAGNNKKSAAGKSKENGNPGPTPDGEYKVSRIIDMHTLKTGKREFLVRWQGWSEKDDTWEPEENLKGNDKLEKFLVKLEKIKQVDSKELRVNRTATDHFGATYNKTLAVEGKMRESKRFQNKSRKCYFEAE